MVSRNIYVFGNPVCLDGTREDPPLAPRYRVKLDSAERKELEALTRTRDTDAKVFRNARALLLCDRGPQGSGWTVAATATALGVSGRTIEHLKRRFVEDGLDSALQRQPGQRSGRRATFDGQFQARLLALASSPAPEGHARWTVRLLAAKAVELNLATKVSATTVQRILTKADSRLTRTC